MLKVAVITLIRGNLRCVVWDIEVKISELKRLCLRSRQTLKKQTKKLKEITCYQFQG